MRWFQHNTGARNDVKLKRLKKKFGAEGYGVYFQLLEIISENVEADNFIDWGFVDKAHDKESLADECGVSVEKLQNILLECNKLGLLEKRGDRLFCEKLLDRLDPYAERIKRSQKGNETKKETRNDEKSAQSTDKVRTPSAQSTPTIDNITIQDNTKENTRGEESKEVPALSDEVLEEISVSYHVPLAFVRSKYDDLANYCHSKGKYYKDYTAALRDWVKKDAMSIRKEGNGNSNLRIITPDSAWENSP